MSEKTDQKRSEERFKALMRGDGLSNSVLPKMTESQAKQYIKKLQADLKEARKSSKTDEEIADVLLGIKGMEPSVPNWLIDPPKKPSGGPGVPALMLSDWHYGEVVNPTEINGKNEYNIEIANKRIRALAETTIKLLKVYTVNPVYPGIVLCMNGDMVSGDIHEELSQTNADPMMKVLVDLYGKMVWFIDTMEKEFGRVFVPVVAGNHGRTTRKPRAKQRALTNFDWLLGALLAEHYRGSKTVKVVVAMGPDLLFSIYGHRYLMTHGDQFRGGDGIAGALMPIVRGDHKKRSRNAQIDMEYDTALMGHFHQLFVTSRIMVNPSLKGLDEYSYQGNFPYEPPAQLLWITNSSKGITNVMPVMVDRNTMSTPTTEWVSWTE